MPGPGKGRPILNDCIEWGGKRYTWSKGFWRCTSFYDRHNLTHRIWEAKNRKPVPKGQHVVFLDWNRHNLDPDNLRAMTVSEAQKFRMQSSDFKALAGAHAIYGKLVNAINEANNPELKRQRYRKAWATRVERYGAMGRKNKEVHREYDPVVAKEAAQKANQTKRERYGSSSKSWETRRERYGKKGHA